MEITIVATIVAGTALLAWPRLRNAPLWRATVTPLASIIGSGFLILGPILTESFGSYAALAMALLCLAGYAFGSAIRYNIAHIAEDDGDRKGDGAPDDSRRVAWGETASSWALAFAYAISVAYYLNLFGAFFARLFPGPHEVLGRAITTITYAGILLAGLTKGFALLERLEQLSVSIKLAIIAALIAALAIHASGEIVHHNVVHSLPRISGWDALLMMFGLIVTVQGFETSRYLGHHYDAPTRQRSMRLAQWLSTAIYVIYVALLSVSFKSGSVPVDETAIIDMMRQVALILGPLLILAALSAQFSAAVADINGSGGLVHELTARRVTPKMTYLGLAAIGLALTWVANVFEIVAYASRAFALYYGIQAALAFERVRERGAEKGGKRKVMMASFAFLAILGLAAALFGTAVEG